MDIHINLRVVLLVLSFIGMVIPTFMLLIARLLEGFAKAFCIWCGLFSGITPNKTFKERFKDEIGSILTIVGLIALSIFSGWYFFTHISLK